MARSDRLLQRYQHETLRRALGPQALSRRRTSCSRTPCSLQAQSEQDPDHRDRRCHEDRLHLLNKTSPSQDFNLAPYPGDGRYQLVRIRVRARQVTLQHFGAEVTNPPRLKVSAWPAQIHCRQRLIRSFHCLAKPSRPRRALPVIERICVTKHTSKARVHWHEVFKFLSNIGGSNGFGHYSR